MPNWNKIVVGNAFKLPSRAPRFYLDLMLWFPTLLTGFWFVGCFHGWRMNQWDVREAALSATVLCFLLLIKERTVLIASMLLFVASSVRLHFVFHGNVKALTYSYLFYGGAVVAVIIGVSFRFKFMKNSDFDPTYGVATEIDTGEVRWERHCAIPCAMSNG